MSSALYGQEVDNPDALSPLRLAKVILEGKENNPEKDRMLAELNKHYTNIKTAMVKEIAEYNSAEGQLVPYMSPLHCATLAITFWRITEAENRLIEIVALKLDHKTLPLGLSITGSYFFPCARALVSLRTPANKLLSAISGTEGKRLSILTWVLVSIHGKENAIALLNVQIAKGGAEAGSLEKALGLIGSVESEGDLLPAPFPPNDTNGL
jgi:hypothetical protein